MHNRSGGRKQDGRPRRQPQRKGGTWTGI